MFLSTNIHSLIDSIDPAKAILSTNTRHDILEEGVVDYRS